MIEDKVLGIPFFKFDLPDKDKVEDIYNVMQTLPFIPNDTNEIWAGGSDLYKNPDLRYLFDWMQDCMVEVSHSMGIPNKMVCVSAWANKNKQGDWFYNHTHPNCFMSSNYYVSGTTGTTKWYYPNPYYDKTNIWPFPAGEWDDTFNLTHEEPTVPGRYIVFPPTIRHKATENEESCDRITVAANWFPTGNIFYNGVSHLNIEVIQ
jgi:hypothetical protein|tara:strand:- start:1689 stop:2303 length:615 start_codon:yes stop_codon:yes gene_type:complete